MSKLIKGATLLMIASTFFVFANNEIAGSSGPTNAEDQAKASGGKDKKVGEEKHTQEELDKQQAENKKKNDQGKADLN